MKAFLNNLGWALVWIACCAVMAWTLYGFFFLP